jgi:ABC-type multidrug transport system fused ATPase/permease subunit
MKLEDGIGEKVIQLIHIVATCLGCFILALSMGWQLSLVCLFSLLATFVIVGIVTTVRN